MSHEYHDAQICSNVQTPFISLRKVNNTPRYIILAVESMFVQANFIKFFAKLK